MTITNSKHNLMNLDKKLKKNNIKIDVKNI